ncbi:MAG: dipeptidase [Verrucomicrobia bacterium]|nr:dipeptidase [Verrucomicrobiota bacterium]MBU6446482.1 dipeptidase [Verrucomicrobiota bacterium]MDE3047681.1 dipeptidase [Verrucomicrobiota bacterium]
MSSLERLKQWFASHSHEIKQDYFSLLRFPSISTDPDYAKDLRGCAEWLRNYITRHCKMKAELIDTVGYPIVYAEDLRAGHGAPTLLVYGHYDVQPVDPLELWQSPPFQPTERNGKIYARGAVDDKGQIFFAITAMRAFADWGQELPVNLKFCIEGEEESLSLGLSKALPQLKEKLKADALAVIDCGQFDATTPAITLGGRGLVTLELVLTGSKVDLHSGVHGGLAYNPNRAMTELLAKVWDANGRVQIRGFYDDVLEMTEAEKKLFAARKDEENYRKEFGIDAIGGEKGLPLFVKEGFRPTFEINGISGGYTGKGFKTVIPAHTTAKISCRLVPNQNPQKILSSVTEFIKQHVPPGIRVEIKHPSGEEAYRGSADSHLARAASVAASEVMGKECKRVVSGGSVPILAAMCKQLKADIVGMGQGLPTDDIHSPNEHFDWTRFEWGFLTFARTLELL